MSRYESVAYELERRRRQEIAESHVRTITMGFYERYLKRYEEMKKRGLNKVLPNEMQQLKQQLDLIDSLLDSDPFMARDESMEVGRNISSLWALGEVAVKEYQLKEERQRERLKREKENNKSQSIALYYEMLENIKDPIVRDFAVDELETLKGRLLNSNGVTNAQIDKLKKELQAQVEQIIGVATKKADAWKKEHMKTQQIVAQKEEIKEVEEALAAEKLGNDKKVNAILEEIESLKDNLKQGAMVEDTFKEKITQINKQIDKEGINESIRKEAVKAIMRSLKTQGFNVGAPQLVGDNVRILAKKVSGKRAECIIDKSGKMSYKFNDYEGMTCLKDIEKFNMDLDEVYGIKLSDKRVLWENPNRISKDAKPMDTGSERRRGR